MSASGSEALFVGPRCSTAQRYSSVTSSAWCRDRSGAGFQEPSGSCVGETGRGEPERVPEAGGGCRSCFADELEPFGGEWAGPAGGVVWRNVALPPFGAGDTVARTCAGGADPSRHLAFTRSTVEHRVSSSAGFAVLSEVAGLAAWLATDRGDHVGARRLYSDSVVYARRAQDPLLWGYMIGSFGQFAVDAGDLRQGLVFLARAGDLLDQTSAPVAAQAWLLSLRALAHAVTCSLG
jgi:hypothetical protein